VWCKYQVMSKTVQDTTTQYHKSVCFEVIIYNKQRSGACICRDIRDWMNFAGYFSSIEACWLNDIRSNITGNVRYAVFVTDPLAENIA